MTGWLAIEVTWLKSLSEIRTLHTYRHDLESFLCVFLSIWASHGRSSKDADPTKNWCSTRIAPDLESLKNVAWIALTNERWLESDW